MERVEALQAWVGRRQTGSDVVTPTPFAALAATLDYPADLPEPGTPLPPLWHWLYFLPRARQSELGPDGHPRRGDFLPPVALPRRMWAGSQFDFHLPLRVGDALTRVSTIDRVTEKQGRSGPLVFVKVRHDLRRGDEEAIALTEFHDIVYRGEATPGQGASAAVPQPAPVQAMWTRRWEPDDVLLFRYSALTFNAHRIHYDRRYATQVEGYPGLVVHGPLLATLLLDLVRRQHPERRLAGFEFRAVRPVFDLHPFTACGEVHADGRTLHLWIADHEGALAMDATALVA